MEERAGLGEYLRVGRGLGSRWLSRRALASRPGSAAQRRAKQRTQTGLIASAHEHARSRVRADELSVRTEHVRLLRGSRRFSEGCKLEHPAFSRPAPRRGEAGCAVVGIFFGQLSRLIVRGSVLD